MTPLVRSLILVSVGYLAAVATPAVAGQLRSITTPVEISWEVAGKSTMKGTMVGQMDADVSVTGRGAVTMISLSPGGNTLCVLSVPTGTPLTMSASNEPGTSYDVSWLGSAKQMTATRTFPGQLQ
jgi:hypothetical protein